VGLQPYPVKKKIVEKPPRKSAGFCGGGQGLSWAVEPRKEEIKKNMHAPTEDKSDNMKVRLYEELERTFVQFPKYHMKTLLRDFNIKCRIEDILKSAIRGAILNEIFYNGTKVVNFETSEHHAM
jgi:hypothetical protein